MRQYRRYQQRGSLKKIARHESGAVLVMMSMVMVVMLGLVALAIDSNLAFASKNQAQKFAQIAALAAIEEYFSISCSTGETSAQCHTRRLEAAELRALDVSSGNKVISNKSGEARLTDDQLSGATLVPGRWEESESLCGSGQAPCFRSLSLYPEGSTPNSFQVEGSFYFGFTSNFARAMFNIDSLNYRVSAISTLTPRRGCFLVDISASAVRRSHTQWRNHPDTITFPNTPACGQGHEYAYALESYSGDVIGDYYKLLWNWFSANYPVRDDVVCGDAIDPYCQVADTPSGTPHCADDYVRKLLFSDSDYNANTGYLRDGVATSLSDYHPDPADFPSISNDQWYLIDGVSDPESLTSIMNSLRHALNRFRSRRVIGDKACIVFYDQSLSWTRVINMTNDFDYLLRITDFSKSGNLADDPDPGVGPMTNQEFYEVTGRELSIRHGLFPRTGSFTNAYAALQESLRQFEEDTDLSVPSSDFVISIGDGLTNCPDGEACNNTYDTHVRAIQQIYSLVDQSFVLGNIPIHVFLTGDQVRPHTVNMLADDGVSCKSDQDYREEFESRGFAWGFTQGYSDRSETETSYLDPALPYYESNVEWYRVATATQGIWAPIRPSNGTNCSKASPLPCEDGERQEFDPYCRTEQQQMIDYMEEILGENPYNIVQVNY